MPGNACRIRLFRVFGSGMLMFTGVFGGKKGFFKSIVFPYFPLGLKNSKSTAGDSVPVRVPPPAPPETLEISRVSGFFLPLAEVEIRCVGCCRKPLFELFPRKTGGRKPLLCLVFSALSRSRRSFRASADAAGSNGGRKKAASAREIVHDCLRGSNLRAVYRKSSAA